MYRIQDTPRGSEMVVDAAKFRLIFEIRGRVSQRERRAILMAVFNQINPLFNLIEPTDTEFLDGWIFHRDGSWENAIRDQNRGIKLRQGLKTQTTEEKIGFEIRMRRLENGLSQQKLASAVGINRGNLSCIEKGRHPAKGETLGKIWSFFEKQTDKPTIDKASVLPLVRKRGDEPLT